MAFYAMQASENKTHKLNGIESAYTLFFFNKYHSSVGIVKINLRPGKIPERQI